jgi:hypothetical protein
LALMAARWRRGQGVPPRLGAAVVDELDLDQHGDARSVAACRSAAAYAQVGLVQLVEGLQLPVELVGCSSVRSLRVLVLDGIAGFPNTEPRCPGRRALGRGRAAAAPVLCDRRAAGPPGTVDCTIGAPDRLPRSRARPASNTSRLPRLAAKVVSTWQRWRRSRRASLSRCLCKLVCEIFS